MQPSEGPPLKVDGRGRWSGEKYAQLSCRWVRRSGRVDDVGESGGTVDDLYMFDGIADGSREALVGKVGFCGLGGDQRHPHGRRYAARISGGALLGRVPDEPQQLATTLFSSDARLPEGARSSSVFWCRTVLHLTRPRSV